ncbi:hypothetical protein [uncultured Draconibacterium sp.]|uniref:hypothetical protein n=1 Tax=uncultured Draconibacterium sp. TaxID=1573823 RepID=UPI0025F59CEB|nr:hypothetical protein [uncultured Draconibacterium sp.]
MRDTLTSWLNEIEKNDGIPPKEVVVFNFGIYQSDEGYVMYLVGGFEFTETNDNWAHLEMPKQDYRYLLLPAMVQDKPWQLVVEYCKNTLLEMESEGLLRKNLLKNAQFLTIAYDEGELYRIR